MGLKKEMTFKKVNGMQIIQRNGALTDASAVCDEHESVVAVAFARNGMIDYPVGQSTKTIGYGDIAIYSFKSNGTDEDGNVVGEQLTEILPTHPWYVMQVKDSEGKDRPPFVRTPWDITYRAAPKFGAGAKVPACGDQLKSLCQQAMNLAAIELKERTIAGSAIIAQKELAEAALAFATIGETRIERREQYRSNNGQQQAQESQDSDMGPSVFDQADD